MADEIERLAERVDHLEDEFHAHQLENATWRGQFSIEVMQSIQTAMAVEPAEMAAKRDQWRKRRETFYLGVAAAAASWATWGQAIKIFFHHI